MAQRLTGIMEEEPNETNRAPRRHGVVAQPGFRVTGLGVGVGFKIEGLGLRA